MTTPPADGDAANLPVPSPISASSVTLTIVTHSARPLHMYSVREDDLEALSQPFGSLSFNFATTALGLLAGLVVTLVTAELSDRQFAVFAGSTISVGGLFVFFSLLSVRDWRRARQKIREIRQHDSAGSR